MKKYPSITRTVRSVLAGGLCLLGAAAPAQDAGLDRHQKCDPAATEVRQARVLKLQAAKRKVLVREPAGAWANRLAKTQGDDFYAALYFLPATSSTFKKGIGEAEEEQWIGFDHTYWQEYDEAARAKLRHTCAKQIESAAANPTEAMEQRRRIDRWILARNQLQRMVHLDVEEMLTIAYLLPQTTDAFDWVFEQRPELKRGETNPRIIGETLSSAESEYFMGLLLNKMSELSHPELQKYLGNFYLEFEEFFPDQEDEERVTEAELEALERESAG